MIDVADVFRRFGTDYVAAHGAAMLPSHRRAIADIVACRTEDLGGQLWRCDTCSAEVYSYHSCGNRSCPKCHTEQTRAWLERRQAEILPCRYFHVVVTVPDEVRAVLRSNQRHGYGELMAAATRAIIELAKDPRFVGGTVGILAVLHTWTRQLAFHPHVHCLVTAGGVSADGQVWFPARDRFLVPVRALAKLVRGKLHAALARRRLDRTIPRQVWRTPWVVHITPWGEGETAVLDYLARYVFRTAITNRRITALDDGGVTFRYKARDTDVGAPVGQGRSCRLSGAEFMRRFLQHVLPTGFHKVRYCGLWHPGKRAVAARVRTLLRLSRPGAPPPPDPPGIDAVEPTDTDDPHRVHTGPTIPTRPCPKCQGGQLRVVRRLTRRLTPRPAMPP